MNIKIFILGLFSAIFLSCCKINAEQIFIDADIKIVDQPQNFDPNSFDGKQIIIVLNEEDLEKNGINVKSSVKDRIFTIMDNHVLPITYILIFSYLSSSLGN